MLMIDIIVDSDADGDVAFELPEGIDMAVKTACAVAGFTTPEPELCIRFSTDAEIRLLNRQWRDKDSVTDVLSFPMQEPPVHLSESLGDIAMAVPFVRQEAARLGLSIEAHTLHLIIHATLHLLGFDHINDDDAQRMQQLERAAMRRIGLHDPYPDENMHQIDVRQVEP